jgi:hypothetical protein
MHPPSSHTPSIRSDSAIQSASHLQNPFLNYSSLCYSPIYASVFRMVYNLEVFPTTFSAYRLSVSPHDLCLPGSSEFNCQYTNYLAGEGCSTVMVFRVEYGGDMFLRNVCNHVQDHTASQPTRQQSTPSPP